MDSLSLLGRIILEANIYVKTGLRIGGSGANFSIGSVDQPVIRNLLNNQPYIPGSSLRGKMRSLTEKYLPNTQLFKSGLGSMHTIDARTPDGEIIYENSPILNVYGVTALKFNLPTRLIVRDVMLDADSVRRLETARTDAAFTEIKTEAVIDRITSAATPRQLERVPAGVTFGPAQMVFSAYIPKDVEYFSIVLSGLQLVEDDYLGGAGARGSGQVEFRDISIVVKNTSDYQSPIAVVEHANVACLMENYTAILETIHKSLGL